MTRLVKTSNDEDMLVAVSMIANPLNEIVKRVLHVSVSLPATGIQTGIIEEGSSKALIVLPHGNGGVPFEVCKVSETLEWPYD